VKRGDYTGIGSSAMGDCRSPVLAAEGPNVIASREKHGFSSALTKFSCKHWQRDRILQNPSELKSDETQLNVRVFWIILSQSQRQVRPDRLILRGFFPQLSTAVSAQDDPVLRTDVSLVQLNVGVVDRQGRAIISLSQGDFAIYEDDVKRPIIAFEPTQSPLVW